MNRSDMHHVYPKKHLKTQGLARGRYNQIANFVLAQSEINIVIGDKPPEKYFKDLIEQCDGGKKKYGGITDIKLMRANLKAHCIPEAMIKGEIPTFSIFLEERRKLMALGPIDIQDSRGGKCVIHGTPDSSIWSSSYGQTLRTDGGAMAAS